MDTNNLEPIKKDTGVGPIIGSIIIIILIVLGGLYFWGYAIEKNKSDAPAEQNSEDLNRIEADLNSTNVDDSETDLKQIDAEINASAQ